MRTNQPSDSDLIRLYQQGNEASLSVLIERHQVKVFGYLMGKLKDEDLANDLFQETFIKVIRTLKTKQYNEEGKFIQWVMRIAHNLVIDHFRKLKRIPTVSSRDDFDVFDVIRDPGRNVELQMIKDQIETDVMKLVNFLPVEQQEVLLLRINDGLSFKEIAEQTEVSINTALGRMRYALINLRKLIEKHQLSLMDGNLF